MRFARPTTGRLALRWALLLWALCAAPIAGAAAPAGDEAAWRALGRGAIVLFRHATAPGVGDPANFRLGDCTTQRNLDATGRSEAAALGTAFRARGVKVGEVWSSRWCRTHETAALAFPGRVRDEPTFDSFFDDASRDAAQTAAARALLLRWKGPGALVVVTHQVNITALTGIVPASGEGVVVEPHRDALVVVGRVAAGR